jgi:hypothetical protein
VDASLAARAAVVDAQAELADEAAEDAVDRLVEVAVLLLHERDRIELVLQADELGTVLGAGDRLEALAGVIEKFLQHRAAREAQQRAREAQRRHLEDG